MSDAVLAELMCMPIGGVLGGSHIVQLAAIGVIEQHEQGTVLFHEGEPADTLRIVVNGRIALELAMPGRAPKVVAALGRGDLLGWSALRGGHRGSATWTATARALKTSHCLAFPGSALRLLSEYDPELGCRLVQHAFEVVAQRLADTRVSMLDLYGGD